MERTIKATFELKNGIGETIDIFAYHFKCSDDTDFVYDFILDNRDRPFKDILRERIGSSNF